jgi:hypothetical protein
MPTKVSATPQDYEAYERARAGQRIPFTSSCVSELAYDVETSTGFVQFVTNGKVYFYLDVPPDRWEQVVDAASKGRSFNAILRDRYTYGEL